jgi:UDP-glucose 4-epimerase
MKYIKKEAVNIIEIDNESDSSQYSVPIIKIPILVSNLKDKKILEEVLMDYGVIISIIDTEIIKEKNLRMESSSK